MHQFKTRLSRLIGATAIICSPCFAEFYAGGSVGLSQWDDAPKSEGTAYEIYGGYQFSEFFAAEIALTDPGSFDYSPSYNETFGTDISGANYSLVLSLPLSDAYGLYAKIGLLDYEVERSYNDRTQAKIRNQDLNYALGFQLNAVDNVWVTFDYRYYPLTFKYAGQEMELNADTFSVGARFTF
ncbi:MAG TPA: porin family protein [Cellvibrionaceae bacterium]|nr:porin family protein [Cellvibrionaceae bacterium]HMW70277.1 porin family protein [Cellvibrionaceae bacterium]HMY39195.1 porin family protein [Marinagarivorans sp.]HNG60554.1 porin family protein [Cellvibrionaceae bacterium]